MRNFSLKHYWREPHEALPFLSAGSLVLVLLFLDLGVIAYAARNGDAVFAEGHLGTILSVLQMLLGGWLARGLYRIRAADSQSELWRLMGMGLVFLAADDLLGLHEGVDSLFHLIMRMEPTPITDRIDDAIVAGYLLVGVVTILRYRREFFRTTTVRWLFGLVVVGGLTSVVLDAVTNGYDVLPDIMGDSITTHHLQNILKVAEDVGKLLASLFLLACLGLTAKSLKPWIAAPAPPAPTPR